MKVIKVVNDYINNDNLKTIFLIVWFLNEKKK